jgi:hypothetical protein
MDFIMVLDVMAARREPQWIEVIDIGFVVSRPARTHPWWGGRRVHRSSLNRVSGRSEVVPAVGWA